MKIIKFFFNHERYRQMAGANIRTALANGVNVYLNNKNVHKLFPENQGFKLFSIEDF